jgi:hypothetical protein
MAPTTAEEELLRDALGLATTVVVAMRMREPFGGGSVAGFDVETPEGTFTYFVDTSGRRVMRETGLATGSPDHPQDRVWMHPADPHLPALAAAAFGHSSGALLARLGLRGQGPPSIVAYRPGRRAVLRVPVDGADVWVKVVPPSRVERIAGMHRDLSAAGIPVPAVRAWSEEGLLVLEQASGTSVQGALGDPDRTLDPPALLDEIDALRARFAGVPLAHRARTHSDRRRSWYAERLRAVLGDDDLKTAERVVESAARAPDPLGAPRSIHGDLHFGQLFVDARGGLCAVIDVDTAGMGYAVDDSAAFVAHAVASALITPSPQDAGVWALSRESFMRWHAAPDASALRARAATHLLGHVLGAAEAGNPDHAGDLLRVALAVAEGDADGLAPT